eukprot:656446-Ditylum_brightwellii.AAC.1
MAKMQQEQVGALDTCCLIPWKRLGIGKVQDMIAVQISGQGQTIVARGMGHNVLDSLISVRHLGDGGQDPLHVRSDVSVIPTQTVKINFNKDLLITN